MLFGFVLDSELLGVFLTIVATVLFFLPYQLYFSTTEGRPRRRHVGGNALFIIVQIIFCGFAFTLLHAFKNRPKI